MSPRVIDTGSNRHGTRHIRRSRPTDRPFQDFQISRAIRAGQLSAERSAETASFRIEQSELQRWLDATNVIRATVLAGVEENPATGAQHAALEAQVERFKEAADLLRSQLVDALSERDEWREAFKQQRALPPPQPAGETPQRWWRWLALTTLLAIVVTAAIVAATVLAISFTLAERPADTVDRLAEPALTGFYEAARHAEARTSRARTAERRVKSARLRFIYFDPRDARIGYSWRALCVDRVKPPLLGAKRSTEWVCGGVALRAEKP